MVQYVRETKFKKQQRFKQFIPSTRPPLSQGGEGESPSHPILHYPLLCVICLDPA